MLVTAGFRGMRCSSRSQTTHARPDAGEAPLHARPAASQRRRWLPDQLLARDAPGPWGAARSTGGSTIGPAPCIACGGAMMVRTDSSRKLGGFDAAFDPFGPEDIDFSLRLRKLGFRALYFPARGRASRGESHLRKRAPTARFMRGPRRDTGCTFWPATGLVHAEARVRADRARLPSACDMMRARGHCAAIRARSSARCEACWTRRERAAGDRPGRDRNVTNQPVNSERSADGRAASAGGRCALQR